MFFYIVGNANVSGNDKNQEIDEQQSRPVQKQLLAVKSQHSPQKCCLPKPELPNLMCSGQENHASQSLGIPLTPEAGSSSEVEEVEDLDFPQWQGVDVCCGEQCSPESDLDRMDYLCEHRTSASEKLNSCCCLLKSLSSDANGAENLCVQKMYESSSGKPVRYATRVHAEYAPNKVRPKSMCSVELNSEMRSPRIRPDIRIENEDGVWPLSDSVNFDSFGKRTPGCTRRASECLILEPSEMIVIDYPDVQIMKNSRSGQCNNVNINRMFDLEQEESKLRKMHCDTAVEQPPPEFKNEMVYSRNEIQIKRSSRASDTSSAYSGSDMMQSSIDDQENPDMDLTGMPEGYVDSDDDEDKLSNTESIRDSVQECLQKEPKDRTEDDIEILLEFIQHFRAFANLTQPIRRELCAVMVFAVIEKRGTVVMRDGEELDSWSVILNGQVEIIHSDGSAEFLQMGDSFGISPTLDKMYHKGEMRTLLDDCQFVCIAQDDYHRILDKGKENTEKHVEEGQVVMVTEHRIFDGGNRKGQIVIRGTPDHLTQHLVQEHSAVDPSYVEDFLLCFRVFIKDHMDLANKLQNWFETPSYRNKVTRVVLLWVNNHFVDFETDAPLCEFLENFEGLLERELSIETSRKIKAEMFGQLRLLNIACAAKARSRTITLTRATREEVLHFSVLGGQERGFGIFISKVEKGSKAYEAGLKRGDQILEVNGASLNNVSHNRALELLRGTTHLSLNVKCNLLDFKELLEVPDKRQSKEDTPALSKRSSTGDLESKTPKSEKKEKRDKKKFYTLGKHNVFNYIGGKILSKMPSSTSLVTNENLNRSDESLYKGSSRSRLPSVNSLSTLGLQSQPLSASNPDLSALSVEENVKEYPDMVVKVYKADQTFKFLAITKDTNARQVVLQALQEFGITEPSSNYSLCEVTVENENLVKQKRLPDSMANLPDRANLNGRYYLKNNMNTETLVPDELRGELIKEAQISLLQLHTTEVASQLTLDDFKVFKSIEPTEYIDNLFGLKSKYGTPNLQKFTELINKEMYWVVTEVCGELNVVKRMRMIKQFIKIAKHCKDCKNFNSMFSILSGLDKIYVSRLRNTWEKLPSKYVKMYEDLKELIDPSKNMSKYRSYVSSDHVQPPMLPLFPIAMKDLTFLKDGNDTKVDGLINFEKFRMIAKEVRNLCNMCSAKYDVNTMFLGTQSMYESSWIMGMATMKRGKNRRGSTLPNAKKMYEEAQMVRRVKSYLSNMKVIYDEDKLREMSYQCEPPENKAKRTEHNPSVPNVSITTKEEKTTAVPTGPKFGAESPQAIQKLMGLSASVKPHKSHYPLPPAPSGVTSPSLSSGRRPPTSPRHSAALRSHPVHLSPESSSVVSLSNIAYRRPKRTGSQTSQTSLTSNESSSTDNTQTSHGSHPQYARLSHNQHESPDSARHSMISTSYDTQSTNSVGSNNSSSSTHSPPPHYRRHGPQTAPPFLHQHSTPPLPQARARPPLPPYNVVMQNSPAYSHIIHQTYTKVRRPPLPDYQSATHMAQLARQKQYWQMDRSHSHEGVVGYCNGQAPYYQVSDDEEEEQVSAV
ncbi:rap guanine nucleotide exchange factor 2-like isoform X2 [Saccostrea echinata]|uniref:rap guanine nucleotide exchange factor 2-like isoform X2 n=1 Tax=Saccostrea echinata TaxID=191078 RepID=UPI002A826D18|nr:rap guanine nucleotide exchange factor 2-like isoform X2 [Saccostrea echinata]